MPKVWADNVGSGGGATLPIAQSDVTNLPTDLAAKVAKTGDTMTGQLNGTNVSLSGVLILPSVAGTTPSLRIQNTQNGIFGHGSSSPRRFGIKQGNIVTLDMELYSIGFGSAKFQNTTLRAEGGFSSGIQECADTDFFYISAGGKVLADNTASAVSLTVGDDLTDPGVVAQLGGAELTITDYYGEATTNNIVVDLVSPLPTGETTATINADGGYVRLVAMDSMWVLAGSQGAVFT